VTLTDTLADIDAIFDRFHASAAGPGSAYGVVVDGALVHSGGRGTLRVGEEATPDADSVFRIASMTKSFTAATILTLRDEGVLHLDEEAARWVPELASLAPWSADSPPVTIRSLLTMSAGLPTDDPWGDRQQALDQDAFHTFLAGGLELAWAPGTRFEYANLGYAILGSIVARATDRPYRAAVEERLLQPLGLTGTGFDPEHVDASRIALGYHRVDGTWVEQPMDGHGAFASMGGLFSTVRDLARWSSWLAAGFPARDEPEDGTPLSRASRREMQQIQRSLSPELHWTSAARPPRVDVTGYGFGLFVSLDVERGRIVTHGGGYPGYGSSMRWHPASGLAVVGLANGRYAGMSGPCREALDLLVDRETAPARRPAPWPATIAARTAVERLVEAWDDDVADGLFAMNVDLDETLASRRAAVDRLRMVHGRLTPDDAEPPVAWSGANLVWWLRGDRGRVQVEVMLNAERPPRVQLLELTSVPEPPAELSAAAERVAAVLGATHPAWPDELDLSDAVDRPALERELRATEAIYGPLRLGRVTGGDGEREARWRLTGPNGDVTLSIERDAGSGTIRAISLVPVARESPIHLA
jgi:CubicO group peptidase (beta-lactamase class C family)